MNQIFDTTVSDQGQTQIPTGIREAMGVKAGTKLSWHVNRNGTITVRPKTGSIFDLTESLVPPNGARVSVEEMGWR